MSRLITISGIDGSGKTTCAEWIKEILHSMNIPAVITDAMKHGIFTEGLRASAEEKNRSLRTYVSPDMLNLSWTADLIYNYETRVKSLLEEGFCVILHRSDLCCRVYSRVFSPESDMVDRILNSYDFRYNLNIHLHIPPELALRRIGGRSSGFRTEKETLEKLTDASEWYQKYLQTPRYRDTYILDTAMQRSLVYHNLKTQLLSHFEKASLR